MTRRLKSFISLALCGFFLLLLAGTVNAAVPPATSNPTDSKQPAAQKSAPSSLPPTKPATSSHQTTSTTSSALEAEEATLKLEKQRIELEEARIELESKRRESAQAAEVAEIEMRQKRVAVQKAELDLHDAQRESIETARKEEVLPVYNFWGDVNEDSCKDAIAKLDKLDRRFPAKPLTIILNTPGGDVTSGLALYDHIQSLRSQKKHHITIVVHGWAASMGGILLQAADRRVVGAQCQVLIHEVHSGTSGKLGEMSDDMENIKLLWEQLSKILSKRSRMTDAQIREKAHKFDWWLSAEEAVKLGFADEIE